MVIGSKRVSVRAKNLRWGVERRLEFVEFRLYWEGYVNRGDLTDLFGVSAQQASADLNRYLGLAPDNMVYDKSAKRYIRGENFKPLFMSPDSSRYLAQLRLVAGGVLETTETWLPETPSYDVVSFPNRNINPKYLRIVLEAIRASEAIEIRYQSLSRPEPTWRWITPHALGFDGFRWHVRAYCHIDGIYKDFLLARILGTGKTRNPVGKLLVDEEWHEIVSVRIGPNPLFDENQRSVVELDYGMQNGEAEFKVRRALLYYVLKRLGLDRNTDNIPAKEQHIVLLNRDVIEARSFAIRVNDRNEA